MEQRQKILIQLDCLQASLDDIDGTIEELEDNEENAVKIANLTKMQNATMKKIEKLLLLLTII